MPQPQYRASSAAAVTPVLVGERTASVAQRGARAGRPGGGRLSPIVRLPTAAVAAASLIAGYAVAVATGSRPLGGLVLLAGGLWCIRVWMLRAGARAAAVLAAVAFAAFVVSHLLALLTGAWPAVLIVAAFTAAVVWTRSDAPSAAGAEAPVALSRRRAQIRGLRGAAPGKRRL